MILRGNVYSEILGLDTGITVITPNSFLCDKYKVVYLFHGLYGNSNTWADHSMLLDYARKGRTVYIMPEAGRSFYTNMKHGFAYYDYVTQELPGICKNIFNIYTSRENTGVMGVSMGGYGALKAALSKPEQYGFCAAFSPASLFLKESLAKQKDENEREYLLKRYGKKLLNDFKCIFGDNLQWKPEDEILALAESVSSGKVKPLLYIACGYDDHLFDDNERFNVEMNKYKIDLTYEKWEGEHNFKFFNEALKKAIDKFEL